MALPPPGNHVATCLPDSANIQRSGGINTETPLLPVRRSPPHSQCLVECTLMKWPRPMCLQSRVLLLSSHWLVSPIFPEEKPSPLSLLGTLDDRFSDMQFFVFCHDVCNPRLCAVARVLSHGETRREKQAIKKVVKRYCRSMNEVHLGYNQEKSGLRCCL